MYQDVVIYSYIAVYKIRENIFKSDKLCYMSFIPSKTTFTKYCLTQWISKLPGSFEIHWVRQYLAYFLGLVGIVNATVYMTELILTGLQHGEFS